MESLILVIEKWKAIAQRKQKEAIEELDSLESNYQLGKIKICNEFIEQLKKEIEQEETSKERNKEGLQNAGEDNQA